MSRSQTVQRTATDPCIKFRQTACLNGAYDVCNNRDFTHRRTPTHTDTHPHTHRLRPDSGAPVFTEEMCPTTIYLCVTLGTSQKKRHTCSYLCPEISKYPQPCLSLVSPHFLIFLFRFLKITVYNLLTFSCQYLNHNIRISLFSDILGVSIPQSLNISNFQDRSFAESR